MSEMQNTADHLIVIGRGRLIADCSMQDFIDRSSEQTVRVRTPQPDMLAKLVTDAGGRIGPVADGVLVVSGVRAQRWVTWRSTMVSGCTSFPRAGVS